MSVVQNEAVAVIIPAPNEAEALRLWLPELAASGFQSIIMVNHGRSDETAEVARMLEAQVVNEAQKGVWSGLLTWRAGSVATGDWPTCYRPADDGLAGAGLFALFPYWFPLLWKGLVYVRPKRDRSS